MDKFYINTTRNELFKFNGMMRGMKLQKYEEPLDAIIRVKKNDHDNRVLLSCAPSKEINKTIFGDHLNVEEVAEFFDAMS